MVRTRCIRLEGVRIVLVQNDYLEFLSAISVKQGLPVDMSLHSDRSCQYQINSLTRQSLEPTIYRTGYDQANDYINDAIYDITEIC